MTDLRPLIIGKTGQLAHCLAKHNHLTEFWGRDIIDWLEPANCAQKIRHFAPTSIVNATAYTSVDEAEGNRSEAFMVNSSGPEVLAQVALELDIPLIHISTDYVFDGNSLEPYSVTHPCNPQNVYGASKLEGETLIRATSCKHYIIRASWVFSETGTNFARTMLGLSHLDELKIVDDQIGRPTYAGDLANVVVALLNHESSPPYGTYHLAGGEKTTWFEFANQIFQEAEKQNFINQRPKLTGISTSQYQAEQRASGKTNLAKRPLNGVLDGSPELHAITKLPDWRQALPGVVDQLAKQLRFEGRAK